ncbi:MAG: DUF4139 domain-containing protein [Planctomycetota bacterium]
MANNQVVIYSNGIADFRRAYEVSNTEPKRISIPVRQDHLADVLASFNVYGDVTLESPPTYRPSNELEGNLSINPEQVLEDLAVKLSGASLRVERPSGVVEGTLVGLHAESEGTNGSPIKPKSIIVLTEEGLKRTAIREVKSFQFLDEEVQTEIDKALRRNYQRIKPNSTFVELVLSTENDHAESIVQYTIPAAAWKISYRLRVGEDRSMEMQGFAIVDNNTDEDWNDFEISVITGEPITFSTDLAESKAPTRDHVDLVNETALGAVEVEGAVAMASAAMAMDGMAAAPKAVRGGGAGGRARRSDDDVQFGSVGRTADVDQADVHEIGNFSVFQSQTTVSIPAKRSTVIPVFTVALDTSKSILHYRHSDHATRPYRAIDFRNEADFSLARGVCTVLEESLYSGNCIVPALKPGESRLLPHALETGVSVFYKPEQVERETVALRLTEGFCYTHARARRKILYRIKSSRDVAFEVALDHEGALPDSNRKAVLMIDGKEEAIEEAARLSQAVRYSFLLPPQSELVLSVIEERVRRSEVELVRNNRQDQEVLDVNFLRTELISTNGPLANHEGVRRCLAIQTECDAKSQEREDAEAELDRLAKRQGRLRENIKAGGQDDLAARWRKELDEAERAIQSIEEERLPALRDEANQLRQTLREALRSLSAEWSEEAE